MKKIGVLCLVLVLALGTIGGAIAYFSSEEAVAVSMEAGTPNLRLSIDNGSTWHDGVSVNFPAGWAPGDSFSFEVWTKNVGNSGLWALYVTGANLDGTGNLCDVVYITDVAYTDTVGWVHPAGGTYYDGVFGDDTGPLTVRELANGQTNNEAMAFCWGDCETQGDYLPANSGRIQKFKIEFTFDPDAGNEYQGKTASFDLLFIGSDDPFTPVWTP
jgi:hypothetical protein